MHVRLCAGAVRACYLGSRFHGRGLHDEAVQKAFSNCQDTVRKFDYENFLWVRSLNPVQRAPVMMLRCVSVLMHVRHWFQTSLSPMPILQRFD